MPPPLLIAPEDDDRPPPQVGRVKGVQQPPELRVHERDDRVVGRAHLRVARIGQWAETTAWHLIADNSIDVLLRDAADKEGPLQPGDDGPSSIGSILRLAMARIAMPSVAQGGSC